MNKFCTRGIISLVIVNNSDNKTYECLRSEHERNTGYGSERTGHAAYVAG